MSNLFYIRWYKGKGSDFNPVMNANGRTEIIGSYRLSQMHWLAISHNKAEDFDGYSICSARNNRQLVDPVEFVERKGNQNNARDTQLPGKSFAFLTGLPE